MRHRSAPIGIVRESAARARIMRTRGPVGRLERCGDVGTGAEAGIDEPLRAQVARVLQRRRRCAATGSASAGPIRGRASSGPHRCRRRTRAGCASGRGPRCAAGICRRSPAPAHDRGRRCRRVPDANVPWEKVRSGVTILPGRGGDQRSWWWGAAVADIPLHHAFVAVPLPVPGRISPLDAIPAIPDSCPCHTGLASGASQGKTGRAPLLLACDGAGELEFGPTERKACASRVPS